MRKRDIAMILAGALLLGGITLWGVITAIDHYAFSEDAWEVILRRR